MQNVILEVWATYKPYFHKMGKDVKQLRREAKCHLLDTKGYNTGDFILCTFVDEDVFKLDGKNYPTVDLKFEVEDTDSVPQQVIFAKILNS